jgi:hypothetical protein
MVVCEHGLLGPTTQRRVISRERHEQPRIGTDYAGTMNQTGGRLTTAATKPMSEVRYECTAGAVVLRRAPRLATKCAASPSASSGEAPGTRRASAEEMAKPHKCQRRGILGPPSRSY